MKIIGNIALPRLPKTLLGTKGSLATLGMLWDPTRSRVAESILHSQSFSLRPHCIPIMKRYVILPR